MSTISCHSEDLIFSSKCVTDPSSTDIRVTMSSPHVDVTMSSPHVDVTMSFPDVDVTMSSHVDVTMSSPGFDVKTTVTSPTKDKDIETSVASKTTSTSSKNYLFEYVAFSLCIDPWCGFATVILWSSTSFL